jgi:glycine/D-amino acid oxidase-like deaminating enzyme
MEHAGIDPSTTRQELRRLDRLAKALLPSLAPLIRVDPWAGLRPMSPDGLPVVDRDPRAESIVSTTGHTRNGILMGPLTGEVVSSLVTGEPLIADITAFSGSRFRMNLPL